MFKDNADLFLTPEHLIRKMQLIITKENEYLELEDTVVIKANEFGVWFWEDFYNIDAKIISKPDDFSKYTNIYEDLLKQNKDKIY